MSWSPGARKVSDSRSVERGEQWVFVAYLNSDVTDDLCRAGRGVQCISAGCALLQIGMSNVLEQE